MKTTKYWQAADANGKVYIYSIAKPKLNGRAYVAEYNCTSDFLYPITLKPLQIAEITVNENGTWSYEIERENGWYMGYCTTNGETGVFRYNKGVWYHRNGGDCIGRISNYTISSNRIPDECII